MRNYTVISTIRAQGCSGNNKSADYSSADLGLKGKEGEKREKAETGLSDERKRDAGWADTHVFHSTEMGTGFPLAWQVSNTFVRPKYQLLS